MLLWPEPVSRRWGWQEGGLGGGSQGLLLSVLGLTDGVPRQHQFLQHDVHGALRGEVVFLKEEKEGRQLTKGMEMSFLGEKSLVRMGEGLRDGDRRQSEYVLILQQVRLTARDSQSSPTGPLAALLEDLENCAWYRTTLRKPSSPTSVMRFPGGRSQVPLTPPPSGDTLHSLTPPPAPSSQL